MPILKALTTAGLLAGTSFVPAAAIAGQTPVEALLAAERAASDASARSGFAPAIAGVLAADGVLLWPGAPVVSGAAAVGRLLSAQRVLDSLRISWQPLGVELSGDGALGVTWGVAVAVRTGTPQIGRYIAAWQRDGGAWTLAALVTVGVFAAGGTVLPADIGPLHRSPLAASGNAAAFIVADVGFARLAADSGAAVAFERFAAPDAVTFGAGVLNRGPAAIGASLSGGPPTDWTWAPVLSGASASRDLGWTVGESEITPRGGVARPGKYLTIWRRMPDGRVRFLIDGGNARPAAP